MQKVSNNCSLPTTVPDNVGGIVRGVELLPLAIFSLVNSSSEHLDSLVAKIDNVIDKTDIHLVRIAPESMLRQATLTDALDALAQYGKTYREDCDKDCGGLEYHPYAFLAVTDEDWAAKGIFMVAYDCEEPYTVTGFRMRAEDAQSICTTVQNDDDGIEVLKEQFEFKLE